jgi:hypothetical protein
MLFSSSTSVCSAAPRDSAWHYFFFVNVDFAQVSAGPQRAKVSLSASAQGEKICMVALTISVLQLLQACLYVGNANLESSFLFLAA